jgi:hypothetical protein
VPGSRTRHVVRPCLAAVLLAAVAGLAAADSDPPEELLGDWYVLVHYRDAAAADPAPPFWDDEIWRVARRADGLSWTLHPHVTLRDDAGRFETLPSGAEARTATWSPSESQLEEIRSRLVLDEHESRSKTLRGSPQVGWRSSQGMRSGSASMIAYQESWSISGPPGAREMIRQVIFESARSDRAEGRTVHTVRESRDGGELLLGDYSRDGRLVGEFRMIRIQIPRGSSR